jgi:hypothetical protein
MFNKQLKPRGKQMKRYTINWDNKVIVGVFFDSNEAWKWIANTFPSRAVITVEEANPSPLERLRHHVSGAIERGEAEAIIEVKS